MIYKLKVILGYGFTSSLVGAFSYVYLSFVPGVFNLWMVGAFCVPILAGLVEVFFGKTMSKQQPLRTSLFRLATATITVQVILKGIFEIALTTFRGEIIYVVAWIFLFLTGLMVKE